MQFRSIPKNGRLILFSIATISVTILSTVLFGKLVGEVVFAVFLISWIAYHSISKNREMRSIQLVLREYQDGNFTARVENAESSKYLTVNDLAFRINRLGEQLEKLKHAVEVDHTAELIKADRLASVGELAASVAHEIRNPVAGIANAIHVLSREIENTDENRQIYDEIQNQAQRVSRAINNLLHYTRPTPLDLVPCELNFPLNSVMVLLDVRIRDSRIKLNIQLEEFPPNVLIDVQQIQQVLVNLILNAIQAMPDGGILSIDVTSNARDVELLIKDSGKGIPDDILPNIFKPFYTTKHKGTGLGLAISRKITEEHSGTIGVESGLSNGAGFRIRLPIHNPEYNQHAV